MIVRSKMVAEANGAARGGTSVSPTPGTRVIRIQPHPTSRLAFLTEPTGLAVEQYKLLRGRLNALQPRGGVLLVTSPGPREGKTLTSINLSWSLAEGGFRTCLVDLDFRAPGVALTLGQTSEQAGVEEVLTGKQTIAQVLCQLGDLPMHLLPIRQRVESPSALFSPEVLGPLLINLRGMYQWVILDLSPAVPMSDVAEVIPQVDGALMVVRAGKTVSALVSKPLEILGSKLWGVVLNDSPIQGSAYYGEYGTGKR
jgi:capsular exopolysaccharide synthesis family protein